MIRHFLYWDFRTSLFFWMLVGVALLLQPFLAEYINPMFVVFLAFIFQAIKILGSKVRDQHLLSRHYLLALPMTKSEVYGITLIRLTVPAFPLILLSFITDLSPSNMLIKCVGIPILFLGFLAMLILNVTNNEEIRQTVEGHLRFLYSVRHFLMVMTLGFVFLSYGLFAFGLNIFPKWVFFGMTLLLVPVVALLHYYAYRKWIRL